MKKLPIIILIVVAILSLCVFAACQDTKTYDALNEMAAMSYSNVVVKVNYRGTTELNAKFDCDVLGDAVTIEYSYERVAKIQIDDGIVMPENRVVTISGTAVVENGKLTSDGDNELDVRLEQISLAGLAFKAEYFKNVKTTDTTFSADVVDAKGFTGNKNLQSMSMKVSVSYLNNHAYSEMNGGVLSLKNGSVLRNVTITYVDVDTAATVTLTYDYTK